MDKVDETDADIMSVSSWSFSWRQIVKYDAIHKHSVPFENVYVL
jgi:hypothetical protein